MNGSLEHLDQPDPDSIKMFVGQIPRSWSETELKELFEPFGAVHQINILRDRTQNPPQSKGTVWAKGSLSGIICSTTLQAKFLLSDLDFNILKTLDYVSIQIILKTCFVCFAICEEECTSC